MPVFGEHAFGMKLHAFNIQHFVAHAHDFAIVCPGRDLQHIRASAALNRQRMVAVDRELARQVAEYADLRGSNDTGLAMHQFLCTDDGATKGRADGLMTQTNTQNWQPAGKMLDGGHRDARLIGRAGAR